MSVVTRATSRRMSLDRTAPGQTSFDTIPASHKKLTYKRDEQQPASTKKKQHSKKNENKTKQKRDTSVTMHTRARATTIMGYGVNPVSRRFINSQPSWRNAEEVVETNSIKPVPVIVEAVASSTKSPISPAPWSKRSSKFDDISHSPEDTVSPLSLPNDDDTHKSETKDAESTNLRREYDALKQQQEKDWKLLFTEIVSHRRLLMNKLKEKFDMSRTYLLKHERLRADDDMLALQKGFDNYANLVLTQGRYREFADASDKTQLILTSHDRAQAILNFLQLADRQRLNFEQFLDTTTTPEAVAEKCSKAEYASCEAPCRKVAPKFFGLQGGSCAF